MFVTGLGHFEIREKPSHGRQKTAVAVWFIFKTAVFGFGFKTVTALEK